jgi:hypothetical protein
MKQKSWRTTTAGVLTILASVIGVAISVLNGHSLDAASITALVAAVTTGAGLIKAGDDANMPPKP